MVWQIYFTLMFDILGRYLSRLLYGTVSLEGVEVIMGLAFIFHIGLFHPKQVVVLIVYYICISV